MNPHLSDTTLPEPLRPPLSRNVALLLESRIPARLAWTGAAGRPRVAAIWFHWDGTAVVMTTFSGAAKLEEIDDRSVVAISIDTDTFPYRSLRIGGPVTVAPCDGLSPEYRLAAARYLGEAAGEAWCRSLAGRSQVVIRLTPRWATEGDMSRSPFLADPA